VNTSGKGARIERIAIKWLQAQGYHVHRTLRSAYVYKGQYRNNRNDVFGSLDLLAKRKGERLRLIQVTVTRDKSRKTKRLAEVPWDTVTESVEVWRWVGGAGPRTDRRTGLPRPRFYFQLYRLDTEYKVNKADRIFTRPHAANAAPMPPTA
jgi:hypothetical protein